MSDREMVAALSAGDRYIIDQLYDAYGARLYAYAYESLADRQSAAHVLSETFIVAAFRINELADPDRFGAWLYALTRDNCLRRGRSVDVPSDTGSGVRGDPTMRVALDCYALARPEERELLDLAFRHRVVDEDLALILRTTPTDSGQAVDAAHDALESAMTVVLAHREGEPACDEAASLGARFDELDGRRYDSWLAAVGQHVDSCLVCTGFARQRRLLQYFEALPYSAVPQGVREMVIDTLAAADSGDGAYAKVAARAGVFDEMGFPLGGRQRGRARRLMLPVVGAAAVLAIAAVIGVTLLGGSHTPSADLKQQPVATPAATTTSPMVTVSTTPSSPPSSITPTPTPTPTPSTSSAPPPPTTHNPPPTTPPGHGSSGGSSSSGGSTSGGTTTSGGSTSGGSTTSSGGNSSTSGGTTTSSGGNSSTSGGTTGSGGSSGNGGPSTGGSTGSTGGSTGSGGTTGTPGSGGDSPGVSGSTGY